MPPDYRNPLSSKTLWAGAITTIFAIIQILQTIFGFELPETLNVSNTVELVMLAIGLVTIIGRLKQDIKPIRSSSGYPHARSPLLAGLAAGVLFLLSGCSLVPFIGEGPYSPGGDPVSEAVDTAAVEATRAFALGELVYTQVARGATELVDLGAIGRSDLVALRDLNLQAMTWLERGHAATTAAGKLASAEGLLGIIGAIEAINPGPAIAPAGTTELRAELAEARQGELR